MQKVPYDVFDIIGPIMIGPSSSHTAGAVRIGLIAGQICDFDPSEIHVFFHGSLASTYSAHKTDVGVTAGILGILVDDERVRTSVEIAKNKGIKVKFEPIALENAHPSTIIIEMKDRAGNPITMRSATIGGGNIIVEEMNDFPVNFDGKQDVLLGLTSLSEKDFKEFLEKTGHEGLSIGSFTKTEKGFAFKVMFSCDGKKALHLIKEEKHTCEAYLIRGVMPLQASGKLFYKSCIMLVEESERQGCSLGETVIRFEMEKSGRNREQVLAQMLEAFLVMKESIKKGLECENVLLGGIFQGNALKMDRFLNEKKSLAGPLITRIVRNAFAVMEVNGSMGKIVACPTAGSAGTVPAVLVTLAEEYSFPDEEVVKAMFTGAGIVIIIAENATISGAVGGCQAECGSASAMAAAIVTSLYGGNSKQILSSVSLALGNVLGMVCDPVAGMVEIPCIQRNTIAAANAIISAEMALAGVDSVIPADEMISALDEVGKLMDPGLKDSLGAGMSNTPTARRIEKTLLGHV